MAEALVTIGLVANVVEFVNFSTKIIRRLNELRTAADNVPKTFQDIDSQLRLVRTNIAKTEEQARAGQLDQETEEALNHAVQGCLSQIKQLDDILKKLTVTKSKSWLKRGWKVVLSTYQEKDVREIMRCINDYVQHLTHFQTLSVQTQLPVRPPPPRKTPSFSTVPYPRDKFFTGRKDQLKQLDDLFKDSDRAALFGLGGVGKSQIAIEYSHRFRILDPGAIVLWVYAGSIARIDEAYKDIADRAQIAGFDDPSVDKYDLVSKWLRDEASTSWLMVIDNADTEDTFFEPLDTISNSGRRKTFSDFIPSAPNGKALITSRSRAVATKLAHIAQIVEVPSLSEEEGRDMLKNAVPGHKLQSEAEVKRLLQTLEYLPLAISQAAAFINEYDVSVTRYLEILHKNDQGVIDALNDKIRDSRRDKDSLNSVIAGWKLSFDYLRDQTPVAAELLSLMSMLDRTSIPESLLFPQAPSEMAFLKAIGSLKSLSLIQESESKQEYTVHRLIHLATRTWIEKGGEGHRWHQIALEAVNKIYPAGKVEDWKLCSELEPHAEAVLVCDSGDKAYRTQTAALLLRSARNNYSQYQFNTALERVTRALKLRRELREEQNDGIEIAECLWLASWCHFAQKNFQSAILVGSESLQIYETVLGSHAPETMKARSNLAKFLTKNGQANEALEIQLSILQLQREQLGDEHEDVLFTMNRTANTLRKLKRYNEAVKMYEDLIPIRRRVSGNTHHATLDAILNYGTLLCDLDRDGEGLPMLLVTYEEQKLKWGDDHLRTKEVLGVLREYETKAKGKKSAKGGNGDVTVQSLYARLSKRVQTF